MYNFEDTALVLEGGGLRGIYSSAILDYFIEKQVNFPYVIGVSAGAIMAASYLSKQKERNLRINTKYLQDKRYMSLRNLIKEGYYFSKEFAYRTIPNDLEPFDYNNFYKGDFVYKVGTFDCLKGKNTYINLKEIRDNEKFLDILMASASLPFLSKMVNIDKNWYLDGGLGEAIPIYESIKDKNKKHVVILTRDIAYRKKEKKDSKLSRIFYKKHPKVAEAIVNRAKKYNETLDYLEKLEKKGEVFIIRPSKEVKVDRIETKTDKIFDLYKQGREDIKNIYDDLIKYLNKESRSV